MENCPTLLPPSNGLLLLLQEVGEMYKWCDMVCDACDAIAIVSYRLSCRRVSNCDGPYVWTECDILHSWAITPFWRVLFQAEDKV